jgi:glycosyltransferase involved in cell wall biosynthesis
MMVNWVSPLPPARSGIARYSGDLLPLLADRADVAVFTEAGISKSQVVARRTSIRSIASGRFPFDVLNRADLTFYNIGNNPHFHPRTWELSRRHAGIVILHDTCLQHLIAGAYLHAWHDAPGYIALMGRYYGQAGVAAAHALIGGRLDVEQLATQFPLTSSALDHALGAIVHTRAAFDQVRRQSGLPVLYAPLPYRPREHRGPSSRAARPASKPPYRLIMFGDIGRNRGLAYVVEALAGLPHVSRLRLDIYGDVVEAAAVEEHIRARRLGRIVKLHGYVRRRTLEDALRRAHLAINLRTPTMGEASLSQLEMWSYSLPTLVTREGWYERLDHRAVAFVRPRHEVPDIREHLRAFLADPERFARMGRVGRQILTTDHSPERYVTALLDFGRRVAERRLRRVANDLAGRAGSAMPWARYAPKPSLHRVAFRIAEMTEAAVDGLRQNLDASFGEAISIRNRPIRLVGE